MVEPESVLGGALSFVHEARRNALCTRDTTVRLTRNSTPCTLAKFQRISTDLETRYPAAATVLAEAEHDVTAYADFPRAH